MVGSAILTTVPSINAIDEPMIVATRMNRRRSLTGASAASVGVAVIARRAENVASQVASRHHTQMGVTYELIDAPYPCLCAVYRCDCGGSATSYGDESGELPRGWHRVGDADVDHVLCPGCAARAAEPRD